MPYWLTNVADALGDAWLWLIGLPYALDYSQLSAISTAVTALFTLVLAWVGLMQVFVMRGQRRLQRAYLFGGCGETWLVRDGSGAPVFSEDGNPFVGFVPGCRNYGQTPAWVRRAVFVFCADPPPRKPNYKRVKNAHITTFIVSDSIPPDGEVYKPFSNQVVQVEMRAPTHILYGRIYYTDMLRKKRHTSFIYRIKATGDHERIDDLHPDYLEWN